MEPHSKPVLLSGSTPTGNLTIGNYIGALRNWVLLQDQYDCLFVLVDLHAITARSDPHDLLRRSYEFVAMFLACGVDPERSHVFVQSHVPEHAQLAWVLNCMTQHGRLGRMTQFKDKAGRHPDNVNAGLFTYPVLMAADILLYETDLVPVGEDQRQHLELTRDLAQRFNGMFGEVFKLPEPYVPKLGARVMSLQDPASKMSKSDPKATNYIGLLDKPEAIRKKVQRAVTDPGREIVYDQSKPGLSNLLTIYSAVAGESLEDLERRYTGRGYGQFKRDLAAAVVEFLRPIQQRYREISEDRDGLTELLRRGVEAARARAGHKLTEVYGLLGLIPQ